MAEGKFKRMKAKMMYRLIWRHDRLLKAAYRRRFKKKSPFELTCAKFTAESNLEYINICIDNGAFPHGVDGEGLVAMLRINTLRLEILNG